jgi:hypothetical protein
METAEPTRTAALRLTVDPNSRKFRTEKAELESPAFLPNRACENVEKALPKRAEDLQLKVDPKCTKSSIDAELPSLDWL